MLRTCLRCHFQRVLQSYRTATTPSAAAAVTSKRLLSATARNAAAAAAGESNDDVHRIPPQLDLRDIIENAEQLRENMRARNYESDSIDRVKSLYEKKEQLAAQRDALEKERDSNNSCIRSAKSKEERQRYINLGKEYKTKIQQIASQIASIDSEMTAHALLIPNRTHKDVPLGPEENAQVMKTVGLQRKQEDYPLLDHLTLAERLQIVDFNQAALVSGSKFYYLKNAGVWLEMALIQYAIEKAMLRGFSPVITPDIVRTSVAYGCGFQPRSKEASQIYDVTTASTVNTTAPRLCLAGTAEIPLAGMFAQKMIDEDQLPQRIVGFGRAFRAEAGHGSAEERGLYRVHQFSKVELFAVTTPSQSEAMLEELRQLQEEIFTELGLCFRVLDMPTEELGASAFRKYDVEAWLPGRQAWGEISSTSNCTDYQSRRLDIRYVASGFKEQAGPKTVRVPWHIKEKWVHFAHTLNGTAIAVPRIIIALLETFQNSDGSVHVPQVLRKWIPGNPQLLTPP